ncbi:MAG: phosphoribosylformylglycinamidine synthase subunit PurS [Acidimicrobiales bacterium]
MNFEVMVEVRPRPGIADPAGSTIEAALPALGFEGVSGVRVGKAIRLRVEAGDEAEAASRVGELCDRLLANPVIEEAEISVSPARSGAGPDPAAQPAGSE